MARTPRLISYASLILLAVLLIAGAYYLYDKFGNTKKDPIEVVPVNTGVFIKVNEAGSLIRKMSARNDIWQDLLKTNPLGDILSQISKADSLLISLGYSEMLNQGNVYIAMARDSSETGHCILIEWPYGADEDDIKFLLSELSGRDLHQSEVSFGKLDGYSLSDSLGAVCYFSIDHGLCIIGSSIEMMNACSNRIENKLPLPFLDKYQKVSATAGRNVDANIYINFKQFPELADDIFSSAYSPDRKILPEFAAWSEIDLLVKNDEILLNGYTETVDSLDQFLHIFKNQEPQKIEVTRILPYNTSILLTYGFNDFDKLSEANKVYMGHAEVFPERDEKLSAMKKRFGPGVEEYMTSWIGNEMALAMINPHLEDRLSNTFMAIHAQDIELAGRKLKELSSAQFTSSYREYTIRRINIPGMMPVLFGKAFAGIENNYYTRIEDYIVFANSAKSLQNFINILLSGKTLEQNENFKNFTDNVSDRSNLFCYFNVRNSVKLLEDVLDKPFLGFVKDNKGVIQNFEALAVQFKSLNNMFFTSAYVKHNPEFIKEDLSIWKAYLDAPVYGQPYFVKDHRTNNLNIVAFDTLNNMYLIDHDGNIVWKLNLGEKVISDVHTVDYYKNGKIQYLFNTTNRIYLIDLLGRDVEGYPVDLSDKATNGLAVFDYDKDRNYRVLLAMDDNRVYNFDIKGKKIKGWKKPLSKGKVSVPVQLLRDGGKDYIIIADEEGNLKITDRRGRNRINLKSQLTNSVNSELYVNETNSKGVILTTDINGKLKYIKTNGKLETTDFGNFSTDHYFLYEDFNNKGGKDFIFLDGNKLTVFDRFKNVMFSHEFENEIHSSPVIIPVSTREKLIGVVSEQSGKIYLFDRQGKLLSTPDHIGKTRMLIGSLNRDGQLNLISGSGNTIYNYYFR